MSATGRSDVRRADDFYCTPAWCTRAIVSRLGWGPLSDPVVLDPCAGDGAILDAVANLLPKSLRVGMEVDGHRARLADQRHVVRHRDALTQDRWPVADLIVMNPPFSLAMDFVQRALEESRAQDAVPDVVALLRLAWLASQARAEFHRKHPANVYVLQRRPSFTGKGTDSADYGWFVWSPNVGGRWEILDIEDRTDSQRG